MPRKPKPAPKKKPAKKPAAPAPTRFALSDAHVSWLDSIVESVAKAGGPRFTREQVLHALADAAAGRPIDATKVKSADDLRVAFGALDLSAVEKMLRERPRLEGGLLKALEDSIK
jgi:hypothetical protein